MKKESSIGKKYPFKRQFKDLWFYAEGYREQLVFYFFIAILLSLVAMAPPYLYGRIIDDLTNKSYSNIFWFLGLTALSYLFLQITHNFMTYKIKILAAIIRNQSRIKAFNHLFNLDFEFYESNPLGQLFSRISTGAQSVRAFIKIFYKSTLIKFFAMVFSGVILFKLNWVVGLFSTIVIIFFFYNVYHTIKRLVELEIKIHTVSEKVYGKVFDFFSNILLVKLLNVKEKLISLLKTSYLKIIDKEKVSRRYERKRVAYSKLLIDLSSVAILTYLAFLIMDEKMTIGIGVMIFGFFSKFTNYAKNIWADYNDLIEKRTGMYRLSLIFENKPKIKEPKNPIKPSKWDKLTFSNISFKYPSKEIAAIRDLSFNINKGERIAIVGLSGSGKSTLAKLLLRLYLPKKGSIKIGNVNIKEIHSKELYNIIKIVPQDNELINTTIYDNLQLTTAKIVSKQEIIESLKHAAAWEFVNNLPDKLKTPVGPDGVRLSGGEKQRICIARALLANPEILVLDEATSNLDVVTERKIHNALKTLSRDITLIAITHRISSVHLFDRIIVMHNGKVVGEGTHKELLKNKYYKKLQEASKEEKK